MSMPSPPSWSPLGSPPVPPGLPRTLVPWLVILLALVVIAWGRLGAGGAKGGGEQGESAGSTGLLILGRSAVGLRAIMPPHAFGPQVPGFLRSLDQQARTPRERLEAAIVVGEIEGAKAAIRRLNRIGVPPGRPALLEDIEDLQTLYARGPETLDLAARQRLSERHGWFGDLALSYGLPDDEALRQTVLRPAVRAVKALALVFLVGGAMFLVGAALLMVALARRRTLRHAYVPPAPGAVPSALLETVAIYLGALAAFVLLAGVPAVRAALRGLPYPSAVVLGVLFPVALLWPLVRGTRWPALRTMLGLRAGRGIAREIGAGLTGYIAGLPVLAVGFFLTMLLSSLSGRTGSHPIVREFGQGGGGGDLAVIYLLACVWAPLSEELIFRGAFFSHLRQRHGWWVSGLVTAVVFAGVHPQGFVAVPALASIALVLAALREWRGSILAPMAAHALNNFLVVTMLALMLG